jgi:hypothetical protein
LVERLTVNQVVAGSSPAPEAKQMNERLEGFYVVRLRIPSGGFSYSHGSGQVATPKLYYSRNTAAAVARRFNRRLNRWARIGSNTGPERWEIVPVMLYLGEPEIHE